MNTELPRRPARLTVDLEALARNYETLKRQCPNGQCAAVVKANAYGLGVGPVARRLARAGCGHFFVARAEEAIELREELPDARIYVFDGVEAGQEGALVQSRIVPVLSTLEQVERWVEVGRPAAVQVDSGMTRLGLAEAQVRELAGRSDWVEALRIEFVMTHLACADEAGHPANERQLETFERLRALLPWATTSIANSAGLFLGEGFAGDLARPGIALYGGNPFVGRDNPFETVATVEARVLQIHRLDRDVTVGYGATFRARAGQRIATLGIGYADGVRRALGNVGHAAVAGRRVPIAGRVSMDLLCIDISQLPEDLVGTGDYVEIMGENVTVDEIASACDTSTYEILTGLGRRFERVYLSDPE